MANLKLAVLALVIAYIAPSPVEAVVCDLPFEDIGGKCLFIDPLEEGTWYNMRVFCTKLGTGGQLAIIDSADLHYAVIEHINYYGLDHAHYWIGGNDEDYEANFKWGNNVYVPKGAPFWRYECDSALTQRPFVDTSRNCLALDSDAHFLFADFPCMGEEGLHISPICEAL